MEKATENSKLTPLSVTMLGLWSSAQEDWCFWFKVWLDSGCFYYRTPAHPVTTCQRYKMPQMAAMGPTADTLGPQGRVRIGRKWLRDLAQLGQMLQGRPAGF